MQPSKQIRRSCAPIATRRSSTANPTLRLTPEAWDKLLFRHKLDDHRVCGFGISAAADPLVIEDIRFLRRHDVTDALDDAEVMEFFAREIERELPLDRCARIWVSTRPGRLARPSAVEEATFTHLFGAVPWSVLFLAADGGATYARLQYRIGPGGAWKIPVVINEPRGATVEDRLPQVRETDAAVGVAHEIEFEDARLKVEDWPVTM